MGMWYQASFAWTTLSHLMFRMWYKTSFSWTECKCDRSVKLTFVKRPIINMWSFTFTTLARPQLPTRHREKFLCYLCQGIFDVTNDQQF